MSRLLLLAAICASAALLQISAARAGDRKFKADVVYCLAETNLTLSDLGVGSVGELESKHLLGVHYLPVDVRGCFMACWLKRQDVINERGTIKQENLPEPPTGKNFPTSFERAIEECKGKKTYCQVGACLYEIYYT